MPGKPWDFRVSDDPRTYADMATPAGLAEIATYADGVGVNKNLIVPRDSTNHLRPPTTLVPDAHQGPAGARVDLLRREQLPARGLPGRDPVDPTYLRQYGNFDAELRLFFNLGLDGMFSDNPDTAVGARTEFLGG